ncbi:beta-galactosidase (plasmid) [Fulvitalea axinellae]|uniref:Beta-galactosidase n=1 Tax=Fulvitalea axinellae TaxID=1182444 RepID=A0AAU9CMK4_9BACT|nr:beta-galactosidase [Fulvitalea axinellae]
MRQVFLAFLAALISLPAFSGDKININNGWRFIRGDQYSAHAIHFDDCAWQTVRLPHDWSILGPFSQDEPTLSRGAYLPTGIGWYRKNLNVTKRQLEGKVFVEFEGVYMNSTVWINGQKLGQRPNGYLTFEYDLTPYLKAGENTLAVRVDNSAQPGSRWYTGSGIYRDVNLKVTGKTYVPQWGTYVTTPYVSEAMARVCVETKIANADATKNVTLVSQIIDASGKTVETSTKTVSLPTDSTSLFTQDISLDQPKLWDTKNPNLYTLRTVVSQGRKTLDTYETTFGVRDIRFDPNKGFLLNGKHEIIKGVCLHQDAGPLGVAVPERAFERQIEIMKAMGANAIRTAHNPASPAFLDLCDKHGILVMEESFDEWSSSKAPQVFTTEGGRKTVKLQSYGGLYFDEWHERDLTDMVLRDRNHPSIIMWSIGNEINEIWGPKGAVINRELVKILKKSDTTRYITNGILGPSQANRYGTYADLDLAGYNYRMDNAIKDHYTYPDRVFIGTENRSAVVMLPRGEYIFDQDTYEHKIFEKYPSKDIQKLFNKRMGYAQGERVWKQVKENPFLSGFFIWTGFDYLGETVPYSWPSRSSYFGAVDLVGLPKDGYHFYRAQWKDEPMVHAFPHWNWEGKEGEIIPLTCFTNCDVVEVIVNGKSYGEKATRSTMDLHLNWDIPYTPGELKIIGKNKKGEKLTEQIICTASAPSQIALEADQTVIDADGQDLSYVTVSICDKDGNLVPTASDEINFTVKGQGKIIGVGNGDPTDHGSFQANNRKAFNGYAMVIIQSDGKTGSIKLKATGKGLKSSEIIIQAGKAKRGA